MIKNIKTIAEAKAKCLNQKDGKQKYVVVEQWLKMFKKWYSPSGNEYTATLPAVEIYSYIAGFNEQGQECYATQKTLANIGMVSDRQVRNIINMFVDMGVLSVEARDGQTSLYKALPFTDAHITPPGESSLSDLSEAAEAQEQPKGHKQPSFDVLDDDWDTPLPWETEETPVSSSEKVANDNEEDVLENFASLICQEKHRRTGAASFIEFANSLACRYGLKRPNGIEAYFAKKHPKVYEDFDIPF
ncbi:hypothetical protein ACRZ85_005131 [Escherichia coli O8:H30]